MARSKSIDPAKNLAEQMVAELSRRRDARNGYPSTVWEIGRAVEPEVTESAIRAAIAKIGFKSKCMLVIAGAIELPCVFKEDAESLASDERILRAVCERLCSAQNPLVDLKQAAKLLVTALKKPFVATWESRLQARDLPDFVDAVPLPTAGSGRSKKGSVFKLHDRRFALPWQSASREIVRALEEFRKGGSVLCEWQKLARGLSETIENGWLPVARQSEPSFSRVIPIFAKEPDSWVVLAEDVRLVAKDPRVIDRVYSAVRKHSDTAVDLAALAKQKVLEPRIGNAFAALVGQWTAGNQVPEAFAIVRFGPKRLLIRIAELRNSMTMAKAPEPTAGSTMQGSVADARHDLPESRARGDFAVDFEDAFSHIDVANGMRNFVKLVDLRRALPQYSRQEFDSGLRELRVALKYALESSEGNRVTLSDEERQAGIQEAGLNLVYCRRRRMQ